MLMGQLGPALVEFNRTCSTVHCLTLFTPGWLIECYENRASCFLRRATKLMSPPHKKSPAPSTLKYDFVKGTWSCQKEKRGTRYTSIRGEEEYDKPMRACGKAMESRTHLAGKYQMDQEERNELEEETRKKGECNMEKLITLDSSEKTIAILGDRWWPQTAKQEGDTIRTKILCILWKTE